MQERNRSVYGTEGRGFESLQPHQGKHAQAVVWVWISCAIQRMDARQWHVRPFDSERFHSASGNVAVLMESTPGSLYAVSRAFFRVVNRRASD